MAYFAYRFVVPTVFGIASYYLGWFDTLSQWIDFQRAQGPLAVAQARAAVAERTVDIRVVCQTCGVCVYSINWTRDAWDREHGACAI